jgi:hypothetical protein
MQARSVIVKVALDLGTGVSDVLTCFSLGATTGGVTVLTPAAIRRASSRVLKNEARDSTELDGLSQRIMS